MAKKQKINLYDFDGTIYKGDSSVDFFLYNLIRNPLLILCLIPSLFAVILHSLHIISGTKMKEVIFSYLRFVPNKEKRVKKFWESHKKKIKYYYRDKDHSKDVIISASPEFLLESMKDYLGVIAVLGTKMDMKTGKIDGLNCHDKEKVRRLNEIIDNYEVMESFSDRMADKPIFDLANKAYLVKGEKLTLLDL